MASQRVFSIQEVEALIPQLTELVARQMARHGEIERGVQELSRLEGRAPTELEEHENDAPPVRELKRELKHRIASWQSGWNEVEALGAVIKDPNVGLVDFYGRVDGKLVYLCWRPGEAALGWYHDLDAGFAGRRPLGPETRDRLLN